MSRRLTHVLATLVATLATIPLWTAPAGAVPAPEQGFWGVVAGFRSWYGSYGVGPIGTAWCVDHGPPAPDAALDYGPADLVERDGATRQAIAWAVGAHGFGIDRVGAAALMLVLHDLMGARYPTGPLDLGRLGERDLAGFDGQERHVLERARAIKADAVSRTALRGPLTLDAQAETVHPGQGGSLVVRLRDAAGTGVAGVPLHVATTGAVPTADADSVTGPDGTRRFSYTAVPGENRFEVSGLVPDLALQSFAPRRGRAQRVARPARVPVAAVTGFTGVPLRRLAVHKTGDASAYLGVGGARFEVTPAGGGPAVGTLVTDAAGSTARLELPAGRYRVREVEPPPGYDTAGPWTVDLVDGDVTLEVGDRARRGRLELTKVDSVTGRPLAGAGFNVDYDADRDGAYETRVAAITTTEATTVKEDLLPGDYRVSETAAPPGYRPLEAPLRLSVAPGGTAALRVANTPVASPPRPPEAPPAALARLSAAPRPARAMPAAPAGLARTGTATPQKVAVGTSLLVAGAVLTLVAGGAGNRSVPRRVTGAAPGGCRVGGRRRHR